MIVLKVYVTGIAVGKDKRNAPILVNLYGPRTCAVSFEFVQLKVWKSDSRSRKRVESSGGMPRLLLVSKNFG